MSKFDRFPGWPYTPDDMHSEAPLDECLNCGAKIPENPAEDSLEFEGFCSPECLHAEPVPCARPLFNLLCAELDGDTPEDWSRTIYEGTDCGAWLAVQDARTIAVGSIVEGCDVDAETRVLCWPFTAEEFWTAVQDVEDSENELWLDTHGCETCAELQGFCGEFGSIEGRDGMTPVHPDCPDCGGLGVAQ